MKKNEGNEEGGGDDGWKRMKKKEGERKKTFVEEAGSIRHKRFSSHTSKRYTLYGGMQDFNYLDTGCMEVTIELSNNKHPDESTLAYYWEENRDALLAYIEQVHSGISGKVTSIDGIPLKATISLGNNEHKITCNQRFGDYYRLVRPGNYQITASCEGYENETRSVLVTEDQQSVRVDFRLSPKTKRQSISSLEFPHRYMKE